MKFKKSDSEGMFRRVLLAYAILILHVVLLAAIVLLVIFLHGVTTHLLWIFVGGAALLGASAYFFYRRMQAEGRTLKEMLASPLFGGRSVEVSLLGGLATFKIGRPDETRWLQHGPQTPLRRLEGPVDTPVDDLSELARLYENNLLSPEEYQRAKDRIFKA